MKSIEREDVRLAGPHIRFDHVSKTYGSLTVVNDLVLDIPRGEFISFLGPSGSGKTTLLMMLAGFEAATSGSVWLDDKRIDRLPPYRRNMGVVFQNYALFPHMSAAENVAFPLQMRRLSKADIAQKVQRALDVVQLGSMKDRRPSQLSGGQQQRVALARALVFEPAVILMDEPLGALDKQLREQMQLDIRDLHRRLGLTIVFVTHDQSEALTMSNRIAVFNRGKIEQIGSPEDIYDRPGNRFVAEFIGETNLVDAVVDTTNEGGTQVLLNGGKRVTIATTPGLQPGQTVTLSIRPEHIQLGSESQGPNCLKTKIVDSVYHGDHLRVLLDDGACGFVVKTDRRKGTWSPGENATASFAPTECWVVQP
jgi:putative spermidine/putrescine transport system ATP-binding protein